MFGSSYDPPWVRVSAYGSSNTTNVGVTGDAPVDKW